MIDATALRLSLFVAVAGALVGCGANTGSPWYQSPPGLTAATGATVSMSANPTSGHGPDGDTRIITVDGQQVSPMEWDKVVLPPGTHTLGVEYNGTDAAATVPIPAMLHAGERYAAKGQKDGPCDATVWLQDQNTNAVLGRKLETHLSAKPLVTGASVFALACN